LAEVSLVTFRFEFVSDVNYDLGVEIKTILVVSAPTLTAISVGSLQKSEHMEIRKMILNTLEGREWVNSV
jgi:hypothetical protein